MAKVFDNLCAEGLMQFVTGFILSDFVGGFQGCHVRIANFFYKISSMLFPVIMSRCYVISSRVTNATV
jgi:hypothetical protein